MDKERVGDGFGSYVKALKYQERISEKNPESGRFFREGTKKKEDLQIVNKLTRRRKNEGNPSKFSREYRTFAVGFESEVITRNQRFVYSMNL